jgi:hypothetical protein
MTANPTNQDICALIKSMESKMDSSFGALQATIVGLQTRLDVKDTEVKALQKGHENLVEEVRCLQTELNTIKQAERGANLRVYGLNVSADEIAAVGDSKAIMKKVYESILKPILTAAKANGAISTVPQVNSLLTSAHPAGKPTKDKQGRTLPPPCNIKFQSQEMRNVVLKYKKAHMPSPTDAERAGGVRKYLLAEDLTRPTHDMFKKLIEDARTCTVWTISGSLRYTLAGDEKKTVHRVDSPFMSINSILGAPSNT